MNTIEKSHIQGLFLKNGRIISYWLVGLAIIAGIFLRLDALDVRILFLDESIHWSFIDALMVHGTYAYDPVYHGPFLYYVGKLFFELTHRFDVASLRLPVALFSILTFMILPLFKRCVSTKGLLTMLFLSATSCSLIYYSNLANYENYFLFFTTLFLVILTLGLQTKKVGYFAGAMIVFTLMDCTKETALVSAGITILSMLLSWLLYHGIYKLSDMVRQLENIFSKILIIHTYTTIQFKKNTLILLGSFFISTIIFITLYSSFGTNPQGVYDGIFSFLYWINTGKESGHEKPFSYYFSLIAEYDFIILFLGFIGILLTLCRRQDFIKMFLAGYALLTFLIYSFIPYKTPWILINIMVPLIITSGLAVESLTNIFTHKGFKIGLMFFIYCCALNSFFAGLDAKYIWHSSEKLKLTYVHTYDSFYQTINFLHSIIPITNEGKITPISIVSPDYWPLPVYIWDFKSIGYYGGIKGRNVNLAAPILITDTKDNAELAELLLEEDRHNFEQFITVPQRPGVTNTIFVDKALLHRYVHSKETIILTKLLPDFRTSKFQYKTYYFPQKT